MKKTRIYEHANDLHVRKYVFFANIEDNKLYYDAEHTVQVTEADLADAFKKNALLLDAGTYYLAPISLSGNTVKVIGGVTFAAVKAPVEGNARFKIEVGDYVETLYIDNSDDGTERLLALAPRDPYGDGDQITFANGKVLMAMNVEGETALYITASNEDMPEYVFYMSKDLLDAGWTGWNPDFNGSYEINSTVTEITGTLFDNVDFISRNDGQPSEDTPSEDTPSEDTPSEDTPSEDTPSEEPSYVPKNAICSARYVETIYINNGSTGTDKLTSLVTADNSEQSIEFSDGRSIFAGYDNNVVSLCLLDNNSGSELYTFYQSDDVRSLGFTGWNPEFAGSYDIGGGFVTAINGSLFEGDFDSPSMYFISYESNLSPVIQVGEYVATLYFDTSEAGTSWVNKFKHVSFNESIRFDNGYSLNIYTTGSYGGDSVVMNLSSNGLVQYTFYDETGSSHHGEPDFIGWNPSFNGCYLIDSSVTEYLSNDYVVWSNPEFINTTPFTTQSSGHVAGSTFKIGHTIYGFNINTSDDTISYLSSNVDTSEGQYITFSALNEYKLRCRRISIDAYTYGPELVLVDSSENIIYRFYEPFESTEYEFVGWNPEFNGSFVFRTVANEIVGDIWSNTNFISVKEKSNYVAGTAIAEGDTLTNILINVSDDTISYLTDSLTAGDGTGPYINFINGNRLRCRPVNDGDPYSNYPELVLVDAYENEIYRFYEPFESTESPKEYEFVGWNPDFNGSYELNEIVSSVSGHIWSNTDFISKA